LADAFSSVVRTRSAAAKHDVRARISARLDDRGQPLFGDSHEAVRLARRADGVDRHLNIPVSAVLEPHGH